MKLPIPRFDQGDSTKALELGTVTPGGGNLIIRKNIFDKIGEFSTELGPVGHNLGGAEDIEWVRRGMSMGLILQYVPDVIQYHYVDPSRLRLSYLMKKAYERSSSMVRLSTDISAEDGIPPYMIRKISTYAFMAIFRISQKKRRHFLVRLAASIGELQGFIRSRSDSRKESVSN